MLGVSDSHRLYAHGVNLFFHLPNRGERFAGGRCPHHSVFLGRLGCYGHPKDALVQGRACRCLCVGTG